VRAELAAVDELPVPEPDPGWEQRAWSRLAPQLDATRENEPRTHARAVSGWLAFLATAAAVVVAFVAGREFPRAPEPAPSAATAPPVGGPDRVLLLAVGDHLERSQLLLVEVMNADTDEGAGLPRERAEELVASSRLVRQAAAGAGEPALADVLDELERVLVEIAHSPADPADGEVAAIHRRIQGRSLLFKVRVLGTQLRKAQPSRAATTS
jgi:hypothetical protein